MNSFPLKDYFEIVRPKYIYLKLTPIKSLRNYDSDKIINAVSCLYKDLTRRIIRKNKKYFFTVPSKVGYYIYMDNLGVSFYFIIPEDSLNFLKDKISNTWKNITIEQVDTVPFISDYNIGYYLTYSKQDAFSLTSDKRNNVLLSAILSNMDIMQDSDSIAILYNFIPASQTFWRSQYDEVMKKFKEGYPIEKEKQNALYIFNLLCKILLEVGDLIFDVVGDFTGAKYKKTKLTIPINDLLLETKKKRDSKIIDTQIIILSKSNKFLEANNNAMSICESFKSITGDNELKSRRLYNKKLSLIDYKIKGAEIMKMTPYESQNLISLPAKSLIEEHKLDCINTIETEVPEALQHGYISLGVNTCKGHKQEAFLRDGYNQGNLPLVLIGEQGSGKSTYISNYINDIQSRGEGAIIIDYIKDCELTKSLEKHIDDDKKIILDLTDIENCQGFGYNELKPKSNKAIDIVDVANRKSLYIQMLIDALNTDGEPLSSLMDRYLNAACNVVFLNDKASLKDVVKCLNDCDYRHRLLNGIRDDIIVMLEDEISTLRELDEKNKEGDVIGTKGHKIDGINHRINLLKKDLRLKLMFQKSCEGNIDLVKAMNEGKIVFIKMPQAYFSTPYSKNVIVTYFVTKIWSAMLVRGSMFKEPTRFHVIIDEVFQAPTAMRLLRSQEILPQMRKFGCKFVVSCQYTKQIGVIDQTLRSAGASYMLMKGSGRNNFTEFKDELYPYTKEDLDNLEQFESLNLINYEDGRAVFITKLPKPLR